MGYVLFAVQQYRGQPDLICPHEPRKRTALHIYGNAFTADVKCRRRAVNIGIDRDEMIDNVLNGYAAKRLVYAIKCHMVQQRLPARWNNKIHEARKLDDKVERRVGMTASEL